MVMYSRVYRDDFDWVKCTFIVSLGDSFESYADMIQYGSTDELYGSIGEPGVNPQVQSLLSQAGVKDGPTPVYYTRRKCRDTSLGGNDAINSYYQYCENDDVGIPFLKTNHGNSGMGRVYSEAIDDNQQILYISCGLPEYNSMTGFYSDAIIPDLANFMNNGTRFTPEGIGRLVGTAVATFVLLPVIPLIFIYNTLKSLSRLKVTKYYDFRPEQFMYYRFVNTIMTSLAVNMGLAKDGRILQSTDSNITGSDSSADTYQEQYRKAAQEGQDREVGLPDIFTRAGWDIYRIMLRRYLYEDGLNIVGNEELTTDNYLKEQMGLFADNTVDVDVAEKTFWSRFFDGGVASLYDANLFVGFRVEKSVDTSESLSNQTGESPVAAALNAKFHSFSNLKHASMEGNLVGGVVGEVVGGVLSAIKGVVGGIADTAGVGGISHVLLGSGMVDVPEVWTGSSFQKNYTFNMALRSPYGDPISIFQSIYIPLSMLLAMALPRAVGTNSYTSPFLVRAYSKGMLGVPLGMIDSITIKRGSDQHGWNNQRLPTSIDVSFTIKDLSPAMYMGMGDESIWDIVTGENSSFQEYLLTLSGLGLNERIRWMFKVRRKAQILLNTILVNRLNPIAWGMGAVSGTPLGRMAQAIAPRVYLPTN